MSDGEGRRERAKGSGTESLPGGSHLLIVFEGQRKAEALKDLLFQGHSQRPPSKPLLPLFGISKKKKKEEKEKKKEKKKKEKKKGGMKEGRNNERASTRFWKEGWTSAGGLSCMLPPGSRAQRTCPTTRCVLLLLAMLVGVPLERGNSTSPTMSCCCYSSQAEPRNSINEIPSLP